MTARELQPTERMVDVFDRGSTLTFSVIAKLRGPLDADTLRRGLRALEARHPLLRARVAREGLRFEPGAAEIPLRVEHGDVEARIAGSLDHRAWSDDGPRAELTWFPAAQTLMLVLHHLVSDGSSGVLAMRDLLRLIAEPSSECVPSPGLRALLPEAHGGLRDKLRAAGMVGREMLRKPVRLGDYTHPFEGRRARLHRLRLDPSCSDQLRARARRDGATVHGVLCAAIALGIASELGRAHTQRIVHPVDLRRYLRAHASVGDAVGYYVSSVDTDHRVDPQASLSTLATEISMEVQRKKTLGEPLLTAPVVGALLAQASAGMPSARFRRLAEQTLMRNTFSLTNLGPLDTLDVEAQYGALELEDLYFVAAGSVLATLGASASTFLDRLSLQIGGVTPVLGESQIRELSERTFALVEAYARGR